MSWVRFWSDTNYKSQISGSNIALVFVFVCFCVAGGPFTEKRQIQTNFALGNTQEATENIRLVFSKIILMMSVQNEDTIPKLVGLVIDANGNQVQVLPTTSETVTSDNEIIIRQRFINAVKNIYD